MISITGKNAPQAYEDAMWKMRICGKEEQSRNGPVITIPEPVTLEVQNPTQRVIFDPDRNANHFFHVMETIWMFAGQQKVNWLLQFNKGYGKYAEDDGNVWGAYGHRWRKHFGTDQILGVVEMLRKNPEDRRAVLGMWDPTHDFNIQKKDVPCNTHIYFRISDNALDMMVCNRSNDLVWGMLGANIVHMTYLQELIAHGVGVGVGKYRVVTNNLHIYKSLPNFGKIFSTVELHDPYRLTSSYPLLSSHETVASFLKDCEDFVIAGPGRVFITNWMYDVALPIYRAYIEKSNDKRLWHISHIQAGDWRLACKEWTTRRVYE